MDEVIVLVMQRVGMIINIVVMVENEVVFILLKKLLKLIIELIAMLSHINPR